MKKRKKCIENGIVKERNRKLRKIKKIVETDEDEEKS